MTIDGFFLNQAVIGNFWKGRINLNNDNICKIKFKKEFFFESLLNDNFASGSLFRGSAEQFSNIWAEKISEQINVNCKFVEILLK